MRAAAAICLAVGLAGHVYADMAWLRRWNTAPGPAPEGRAGAWSGPVARSLTVLIVDGLRHDVAARLPGLSQLSHDGVLRMVQADFPTFTFANLTTVATGVPPARSGVRLNAALPALALDSVSARAEAAGLPVAFGGEGIPDLGALLRVGPGAQLRTLEALAAEAPRGLRWLYVDDVDVAGHHGGAASKGYAVAAAAADALIGQVASHLDPARDALVVLSDHGHRDGGGHGGVEPEVRAAFFLARGPGVVPGARAAAPMSAVAPTLTGWLGLPSPASAVGAPMNDLFTSTPSAPGPERTEPRPRWASVPWPALAIGLRDAWPALLTLCLTLGLLRLLGYRWSFSVPRGELGFTLETLLASGAGWAVGRRWARPGRQAAEAGAAALVYGLPFLACAIAAGSPRFVADPASSFGVVAWGTLALWICTPLGLRGLLARQP